LLAQLIFNKEPSKLIMRGMRLLIGYFEAKATHINLRCFVAEKLVSLSRLKNGRSFIKSLKKQILKFFYYKLFLKKFKVLQRHC